MTPIFVTIATVDFLPRVHALHASLQAVYGHEVAFAALCIDDPDRAAPSGELGFDAVRLEDLRIPTLWDMAFRYEKGAFANALKPFFIQHVLDEQQPSSLIFLDADTLVFSRFEEVHALLEGGRASIVLTPHMERPQCRFREPFEIDLLRHGVLNGGFVALSPDANGKAFLHWWADHLKTDCRYEPERGYYGDQHWLDLATALFDGVRVLRHRGYNAAYWNYPDRAPRLQEGTWRIGPDLLKFFHFSQWRLERGESVEACLERLFSSRDPDLERLLRDYHDRWRAAVDRLGPHACAPKNPFGAFLDGATIPKIVRDAYARLNPPQAWTRERMFGQGLALVMQPSAEVPAFEGLEMAALSFHIWQSRPDLRHHDVFTRSGQLAFMRWLIDHAVIDYGLSDAMLDPARESLERDAARKHPARALLKEVADAHGEVRDGRATVATVAAPAAALIGLFAHMLGESGQVDKPIDHAAEFFKVLDLLKGQSGDRHNAIEVERCLGEIDAHGRYLAEKAGSDFREFLTDPPLVGDVMLEADAILNSCILLAAFIERWSTDDDFAAIPAAPPAPSVVVELGR